jgi:hypothetical protein
MFNRFKNILRPSLPLFQTKLRDNSTPLHNLLPTFTHPDQFHAYVQEHGEERVKRELHTVTAEGYTPISFLSIHSPVLKACQALMNPAEGILPLEEQANFSPNPNQMYHADYSELFAAGNLIIEKTRNKITKSPYAPWMDPTSELAAAIHQHELEVTLALSDTDPSTAAYAFRFAKLSNAHLGQGTSKTFAYVGLHEFAKQNRLGQLEGAVYEDQTSGYHLLVLNNIFYPTHAVFCCPWKGIVLPTSEAEAGLRIPSMHKIKKFHETYMLYYDPQYHKLTPRHNPVHAGSLAPRSAVLDPVRFFKRAAMTLQSLNDSNRLSQVDQALRKLR